MGQVNTDVLADTILRSATTLLDVMPATEAAVIVEKVVSRLASLYVPEEFRFPVLNVKLENAAHRIIDDFRTQHTQPRINKIKQIIIDGLCREIGDAEKEDG